jgi:hypothetical protein
VLRRSVHATLQPCLSNKTSKDKFNIFYDTECEICDGEFGNQQAAIQHMNALNHWAQRYECDTVLGLRIYVFGNSLQRLDIQSVQQHRTQTSSLRSRSTDQQDHCRSPDRCSKRHRGSQPERNTFTSNDLSRRTAMWTARVMLMFMLLECSRGPSKSDERCYRFLWLERRMKIVIELSHDLWILDLSASRHAALPNRRAPVFVHVPPAS